MIDSIASFLDYWPKARARTTRVLDHLPATDLEWTWQPGRFTFGDLLRHLAGIERFMYAENVAGRPSRYPGNDACGPRAAADRSPRIRRLLQRADRLQV